jgi:hypothetical protein
VHHVGEDEDKEKQQNGLDFLHFSLHFSFDINLSTLNALPPDRLHCTTSCTPVLPHLPPRVRPAAGTKKRDHSGAVDAPGNPQVSTNFGFFFVSCSAKDQTNIMEDVVLRGSPESEIKGDG